VSAIFPDLPARCRLTQKIAGALVAVVLVDAVLVEVLRARSGGYARFPPAIPIIDTLRTVFIVLAIVDLALIRFIRSRILNASARGSQPVGSVPPLTGRLLSASIASLTMCLAIAGTGSSCS
jgi:hypothetical protein